MKSRQKHQNFNFMAILMQRAWNVQVQSKEAAREQRFVISGASLNNGPHPGTVGSPAVFVSGNSWSIVIQSKSPDGWVNSTEKIQFPSSAFSGFNIASDDRGGGLVSDLDFNDLVLHCTPVSNSGVTDYFMFGNVSCYEGYCWWNPCFRNYIVIDSAIKLQEALKYPIVRDYIEKVYPDRIFEQPIKRPIPIPDPAPFKPLMLPLQETALMPNKEVGIFRKNEPAVTGNSKALSAESRQLATDSFSFLGSRSLNSNVAVSKTIDIDRVKLAGIIDKFYYCNVNTMPSAVLQFLEYDRTNSELAGGAYTGTGAREILGYAITDSFGNYVFRFQRTLSQSLEEISVDTASGESFFTTVQPDVIVQLLDAANPSVVLYESGLYSNVPSFKNINICFPCASTVKACNGQGIIQYIGDLLVIKGTTGTRGGDGNLLGSDGKISNSFLKCAAWSGQLKLIACLKETSIKYYTVCYKLPSQLLWNYVEEPCTLPKFNGVDSLPVATSIRSNTLSLHIDGGPIQNNIHGYINVANASDADAWITTTNLKALLTTGYYIANAGTVEFRVEGYDAAGNKIASVDETIDLYLDNKWVEADLDPNISLGGSTLGNCALFTLPNTGGVVTDEKAPITVRFRAKQDNGFMGLYAVTIAKGAVGNQNLTRTSAAALIPLTTALPTGAGQQAVGREYTDLVQLNSCFFSGTPQEPTSVGDYLELTIRPENNWLEPDQTFCAFRVLVNGNIRHTTGEYHNPYYQTGEVLIGIQRP